MKTAVSGFKVLRVPQLQKSESSKSLILLLQTWPGKGVLTLLTRGFVPHCERDLKCYRKDLFANIICQICEVFVKPALWMCW